MRQLITLMMLVSSLLAVPGVQAGEGETLWLDVRSAAEYEAGHLPGAINIPHTEVADRIESVAPDKSRPIVLYCRSGRRAGIALQALESMGYQNLTNARDQRGARVLKQAAKQGAQ